MARLRKKAPPSHLMPEEPRAAINWWRQRYLEAWTAGLPVIAPPANSRRMAELLGEAAARFERSGNRPSPETDAPATSETVTMETERTTDD